MATDTTTPGIIAQGTTGRRTAARHAAVLLVAALVGLLALHGPTSSSALFTSTSGGTSQVSAAADWTPPTVSVVHPGASVKGVATIAITAADAISGVASVVLEAQAPGTSTWTTVCTDTTAPYSCDWSTAALADGQYALRARATDRVPLSTTSAVVRTTVANNLSVVLTAPSTLRGTVALSPTVQAAGSLAHTVRVQYAPTGTTTWTTLCASLTSPYACSWDTTSVAAGSYDLRAVVVDSDGRTVATSAVVKSTLDNVAPTVALADPGTPLSGSRTFAVTATDAHSGVSRVVVQYAATGTSTWSDLCTVNAAPWNCAVATSTLADGSYSFRAVATDVAGNSATSAVITQRLVENTAPAVTVAPLATTLTGIVQVSATARSAAGVTSVKLQYSSSGSSTWTDVCTDTTAPYACAWDTTGVVDGTYSVRAVMVDALNRTVTSTVLTNRVVSNRPFTGVDVQTFNNGNGTTGRSDSGDTVVFTYSGVIAPASVLAGWDGTSRTVALRVTDPSGSLFFGSSEDVINVWTTSGAAVNLGTVNLKGDYIIAGRTAEFESTITLGTTVAPDGTIRSTVTVQLGSASLWDRGALKTASTSDAAAMVWTPSSLVTDLLARPCSPSPVTETGPLDREF